MACGCGTCRRPSDASPEFPDATPEKYVPLLREAGLTIVDVEEWEGRMVFEDVGAIVYYLKAIPWEVPGFTVKSHLRYLACASGTS